MDKPVFNDSLGFLKTVDWLISACHLSATDENNSRAYLRNVELLHTEISPRLTEQEEEALVYMKRIARQNPSFDNVNDYHFNLNKLIHEHQLRLIDDTDNVYEPEEW